MKNQKAVAAVLGIAVISAFVLVAVWTTRPSPDVRIGYLSKDLHQLALRVAVEKGWFEEQGLVVALVEYPNGAYQMDGFLAGQIDMGYLGIAPALTKSINQEIGITVLASVNLEGSALMVHKGEYDDGRIETIADLAGKTIFHPGPSTVQNFLLRLALNQSGLTVNDVFLETARPQDMAISLTPEKPAFIAWEPFPSLAEHDGDAVPLLQSGEIWPQHPCCVVATSNEFFSDHPDIVEQVVAIHVQAEKWILENPAEALAIAIDWLQVDTEPVENAFNQIIFDYEVNRTGIRNYLEFLIDQGIVVMDHASIDEYLNSFINTTLIDSA